MIKPKSKTCGFSLHFLSRYCRRQEFEWRRITRTLQVRIEVIIERKRDRDG